MKNIIVTLIFFLPLIGVSQEIKIHKRSINYWNKTLNKAVCCDSIFSVSGWLDAGDDDQANTQYPFLQFTISKSKREGFTIEFNGQCKGEKYASKSDKDSVEIEFENHQKIILIPSSGSIHEGNSPSIPTEMALIGELIPLNETNIKLLVSNSVYKISVFSSKETTNSYPSIQGKVLVRPKYKDEIMTCLKALLK